MVNLLYNQTNPYPSISESNNATTVVRKGLIRHLITHEGRYAIKRSNQTLDLTQLILPIFPTLCSPLVVSKLVNLLLKGNVILLWSLLIVYKTQFHFVIFFLHPLFSLLFYLHLSKPSHFASSSSSFPLTPIFLLLYRWGVEYANCIPNRESLLSFLFRDIASINRFLSKCDPFPRTLAYLLKAHIHFRRSMQQNQHHPIGKK